MHSSHHAAKNITKILTPSLKGFLFLSPQHQVQNLENIWDCNFVLFYFLIGPFLLQLYEHTRPLWLCHIQEIEAK